MNTEGRDARKVDMEGRRDAKKEAMEAGRDIKREVTEVEKVRYQWVFNLVFHDKKLTD